MPQTFARAQAATSTSLEHDVSMTYIKHTMYIHLAMLRLHTRAPRCASTCTCVRTQACLSAGVRAHITLALLYPRNFRDIILSLCYTHAHTHTHSESLSHRHSRTSGLTCSCIRIGIGVQFRPECPVL